MPAGAGRDGAYSVGGLMRHMLGGRSFLTRLARDVRGNTIALAAAAMLPLAGMIGGGVDMSRLYLAKTRLQQACDAGALSGRKAMGTATWTTGSATSSDARAKELFDLNYRDGSYGTGNLTRTFSESGGVVTGTASVVVPMTIMRVFGVAARTLDVNCSARMEIPNTDVMFVLDVTGSMNCVAGDSSCSNNGNVPAEGAKILGLKSAVKCFYEALLKVDTSEVCGDDPTATTYTQTAQIRIGFVPYSLDVNVGKLLPNAYLADTWTYQSRVANTQTVRAWSLDTESAKSAWSNWSPSSMPSSFNTASGFSSWSTPNSDLTVGGVTYSRQRSDRTSSNCANLNTLSGSSTTLIARTDVAGTTSSSLTGTTNNPPTYPASSQTLTYTDNEPHTVTGYRYYWKKLSGTNSCWLENAAGSYSKTRTQTSTKPINWTTHEVFKDWTYKAVTHNVAALKTGESTWAGSVALPLTVVNGDTVKLSGSNSNTVLQFVADTNVPWAGCIEERQTVKNSDGDPSDEWTPIPSGAYDMNIDMVPNAATAGSYWGPMLPDAVWGRYSGSSNKTTDVTTTSNLNRNNIYSYCGTEAKKLQTWYTPDNFETYVDSLHAEGNTYHDIGMIWGARLISPTGIFASQNAATPTGGAIQRHIVFMTDGDTMSYNSDYMSYGISWWDRRQTTYAPSNGNGTNSDTAKIINAHLSALCTAIKNKNITLWVISYGGGINEATEARLETCATSGRYYSASNSEALIARFKQIASEIAQLRLTS